MKKDNPTIVGTGVVQEFKKGSTPARKSSKQPAPKDYFAKKANDSWKYKTRSLPANDKNNYHFLNGFS
jgi:hypothetical protein